MRWNELRVRSGIAIRRRIPGAQRMTRALGPSTLRRTSPISTTFGFDRGTPIERHYLAAYLERHSADITGSVLEIGDAAYTTRFGHDVVRSDVLDVDPSNRRATVIANLETGEGVPADEYDCVICTQTLMFVFEVRRAISALRDALRPGGVLLGSVSGIAQISEIDQARTGEYWRFTVDSTRRLLDECFSQVDVEAFGNVFTALSFLHGLAAEELTPAELTAHDPRYQLLIAFRAVS